MKFRIEIAPPIWRWPRKFGRFINCLFQWARAVIEQGAMEVFNSPQDSNTGLSIAHRLSAVARYDKLHRIEEGLVMDKVSYNGTVCL